MKKLVFAALAAVSFMALAQEPAAAKPARPPMRSPMAGGMGMRPDVTMMAVTNPKVAEKIGLSAETQAKIKDLNEASRKEARALQPKLREAMNKQAALMRETKIDEAAVMAAIDEVFELRKQMTKMQAKNTIAVKALLTPEQIEKAAEAFKEMRSRRARPASMRSPRKPKTADGVKAEKSADAAKTAEKPAEKK